MKHITALILFCTYCYSQDSIDIYENLRNKEAALKSPFHNGNIPQRPALPKVKYYEKESEGYKPSENPFMDTRESWNLVTPTNQAQQMRESGVNYQEGEDNAAMLNAYRHHDTTNWAEIGIISGVIVFMILVSLFIYKLLK